MTQHYLLDTNILSDLIRFPQGKVFGKISEVGEGNIFTSIIVASELRFGVCKKGSVDLSERVENILSYIDVRAYEKPADQHYALIRDHLEKKGLPIGPNDMLIGAHARSVNAVMVTANLREFSRIPQLLVQNWLSS